MAIALAETFDQGNVLDEVPSSWSGSGTWWLVRSAPSWGNGFVAQGLLYATTSELLTRSLSVSAGSGYKIRVLAGTDGSPTERCGNIEFLSGSTVGFTILFFSDGNIYVNNTVSPTSTKIFTGYSANTLYDITVVLGSSGTITSATVNGTTTSTGFGTLAGSLTSVNNVNIDVYNGGGAASGHTQIDAIVVDNTSAVPNGTVTASGTLDGHTLGPDSYGGVLLGFTNGTSVASTIYKLERSADGGTTWAAVGCGVLATTSGFLVWDGRPAYGSQPVHPGSTATYRVTAMNASGNQVTSTVTATPAALAKSSVDTSRFAELHSLCSAQVGGYYPSSAAGELYAGYWVMAMAYAYLKTGTASYKTDCLNAYNYIKTWADSNGVLISPADTTLVYRDYLWRAIYHVATAGRLLRLAGDTTDANAMIASCDTWAQAWFNHVNSGSPTASLTQNGWDASNGVGVPAWAATTFYATGHRVAPSVANGFVYEAQNSGTSGTSQPTFPTSVGSTVVDKDVTWKNVISCNSWAATTSYSLGDIVKPPTSNGFSYRCVVAGTSGGSAPTWSTTQQATFTDGGVTWRVMSTTQNCSYSTYTNNGTTYPSVGSPTFDSNQLIEQAGALALLVTDPVSAFNAGALKTTATGVITAITSLATAYQASGGRTPIGDPVSPTDGRAMYDTRYASYAVFTLAAVQALAPSFTHADTKLYLNQALNWFDGNYATEPLNHVHYDSSAGVDPAEVTHRTDAYLLLSRTPPLTDIDYSGAYNFPWNNKIGFYNAIVPSADLGNDAEQSRMFAPAAQFAVIPFTPYIPANYFFAA